MWDYNKLFAEGNVVGIKESNGKIYHVNAGAKQRNIGVLSKCHNDSLSFDTNNGESFIQYIIRLDEHGNVTEKLFDREIDMPKPMPELEDGMFIRVIFRDNPYDQTLGFINLKRGQIVYQDGGYDLISNMNHWIKTKIVEIYAPEIMSFTSCEHNRPIWRDPDYQVYLDSKFK